MSRLEAQILIINFKYQLKNYHKLLTIEPNFRGRGNYSRGGGGGGGVGPMCTTLPY